MNPFKRHEEPKPPPPAPADTEPKPAGGDTPEPFSIVDETAALIEQLQHEAERLRAERDQAATERDRAVADWKRAMADFQNFQRRAAGNEHSAREQAVRGVLHSILPLVDHFDVALSLNPDASSAKQVIDGVSMIKDELLRALTVHGVQVIRPGRNDPFDPNQHKAIVQQPAEGVEAGNVVQTLRLGYALEGRVLRPAEVMVATGSEG